MYVTTAFIFGTCLSSGVLCWYSRKLKGESWIAGRSRCDNCGVELHWHEIIPILSFLLLHGKCRHCGTEIDRGSVLSELMCGMLLALAVFYTLNPLLIGIVILLCCATVCDIFNRKIPKIFLDTQLPLAILYVAEFYKDKMFWSNYIFAVVICLMLILLRACYHGGLGDGDVIGYTTAGLVFGFFGFCVMVFSGIFAIGYYVICHKSNKSIVSKDGGVALLPFIAIGFVVMLSTGLNSMNWVNAVL